MFTGKLQVHQVISSMGNPWSWGFAGRIIQLIFQVIDSLQSRVMTLENQLAEAKEVRGAEGFNG
jgi:hypothetical protein